MTYCLDVAPVSTPRISVLQLGISTMIYFQDCATGLFQALLRSLHTLSSSDERPSMRFPKMGVPPYHSFYKIFIDFPLPTIHFGYPMVWPFFKVVQAPWCSTVAALQMLQAPHGFVDWTNDHGPGDEM